MWHGRINKLADLLVNYSTQVQPGDVVSLTGSSSAQPLLVTLHREVLLAGGHPVVRMAPDPCEEILFRYATDDQLAFVNPLERWELEFADVAIHALTLNAGEPADSLRQGLRQRARKPLLDLFLQRTAARQLRWVVAQYPSPSAAHAAKMTLDTYAELVFQSMLLEEPDPLAAWKEQAERQERMVEFLHQVSELHFSTPQGTDIRVNVAGRTWINGSGQENFPDGEVYTAPVENGTDGIVYVDVPSLAGGRETVGARLVVRDGRVVDATAESGEESLLALLNQDDGARGLGEVGLGCNYALTQSARHPLLDEKIGGTFHVALGAAYPLTGGTNQSGIHWDLVVDLRCGGRIEADGRLISQNGSFTNAAWPRPDAALV